MEQNEQVPVSPVNQPKSGLTQGVWSIILAVLALAFFPPLLGAAGLYLGYRSKKKGQETLGTVGMALSIVCGILGMFVGAIVNIYLQNHK